MRTKGKWLAGLNGVWDENMHIFIRCDTKADTDFITLAGTVANQLDEQGVDGEKAIEMLPEILTYISIQAEEQCWFSQGIMQRLRQPQPEQPVRPSICPNCSGADYANEGPCGICSNTTESDLEQRRRLDGKEKLKCPTK